MALTMASVLEHTSLGDVEENLKTYIGKVYPTANGLLCTGAGAPLACKAASDDTYHAAVVDVKNAAIAAAAADGVTILDDDMAFGQTMIICQAVGHAAKEARTKANLTLSNASGANRQVLMEDLRATIYKRVKDLYTIDVPPSERLPAKEVERVVDGLRAGNTIYYTAGLGPLEGEGERGGVTDEYRGR